METLSLSFTTVTSLSLSLPICPFISVLLTALFSPSLELVFFFPFLLMQDGVSSERGEKRGEGGERTGWKRREKLIRGKQN